MEQPPKTEPAIETGNRNDSDSSKEEEPTGDDM